MDRTLGPYQLGDSLGKLPFGELVEATHPARSEPLAVLLLDDRLAKDHRFRGLLRLEIARAGAVRHPAIARTVEVGEHEGALYLVFERPADAQTLERAYAEGDPPSRDEALGLVRRLAEGLDAAHGRRLVHGAIDPNSVLVGSGNCAALVGIALTGAVDEAGLTAVVAESVLAAFTAPEQRVGKRSLASADGYALGVLAAALLRVQPPPAGPADPIGDVLARQRSPDPASRFPSCSAFAGALADAMSPTVTASTVAPAAPQSSPAIPDLSPAAEPAIQPPTVPTPAPSVVLASAPPSAPVPPTDPPSAERPPLPWDVPATPDASLEADTLNLARPPALPSTPEPDTASQRSLRPPEPPSPGGLGGWIGSVIDPPRPAGPATTHQGIPTATPAPRHPDPPTNRMQVDRSLFARDQATDAAEVSVTAVQLTPAIQAAIEPPEPRDLIGDGIIWAGNRCPDFDDLLDRYAPNGMVRGVPLGLTAVGALSVLMLLAGQLWPATVVIMIAAVLYGVPRLGAALTASERVNIRAVRVAGGARLHTYSQQTGAQVPELTLPNGVTLNVRTAEYEHLGESGLPVTIERPVYPMGGVRSQVVGYDLPGATITYLEPTRVLLDVRTADGRVVYRRPPYQGEPDDVAIDALPPDPTQTGAPSDAPLPWSAPANDQNRGERVPLPPAVRESIQKAAASSARTAAMLVVVPLVGFVVLSYVVGFFASFILVALFGVFSIGVGQSVARALRLWPSRQSTAMVRIDGPVVLTRHRYGKTYRHAVRLADGTSLKVDSQVHGRLSRDAELRVRAPGFLEFDTSRNTPDGYLQTEHQLPNTTVFYEPTGQLLLEVRNPFGATLYREPALGTEELGHNDSKV